MISSGKKLDLSFKLKVVRNGAVEEVPFQNLITRPTVVSVYMKNNTPSCDRQNTALASVAATLERAGVGLIAVSRDSCGSHAKYAAKHGLGYVLASDPEDRFAQATDSLVEKSMYGKVYTGPARAAYLIGADGRVLGVIEKVDSAAHAEQVKELIKAAKPAKAR